MKNVLDTLKYIKATPWYHRSKVDTSHIEYLIKAGLIAGDYSRAYVTDRGDNVIDVIKKIKDRR